MHRSKGAAGALLLVAAFGCEAGERREEHDALPRADTVEVRDTAAGVGDTLMARDTMP